MIISNSFYHGKMSSRNPLFQTKSKTINIEIWCLYWNTEVFGDGSLENFMTLDHGVWNQTRQWFLASAASHSCTHWRIALASGSVAKTQKSLRSPASHSNGILSLDWETWAPGNPQVKEVNWKISLFLLINQWVSKLLNNVALLWKTSNQL